MPTVQTGPIHFEDFDGATFERLVFAYHLRTGRWKSIDWYGQIGSDLGRDILAVQDDDTVRGKVICIQCANHHPNLPATKAIRDTNKALKSPTQPATMRFVCGGGVTAKARDKIKAHSQKQRIQDEVWSGTEFEERLRRDTESLLQRFVEGVVFPDAAAELGAFVASIAVKTDAEAIALLARLFDRPAFYTPFRHESCIPAFRVALTDTIRALGTGERQTREGKALPRIPSRHDVRDPTARNALAKIERAVVHLRARFEARVKDGDICVCADRCGIPDCPVFELRDPAIDEMDELRSDILDDIAALDPSCRVGLTRALRRPTTLGTKIRQAEVHLAPRRGRVRVTARDVLSESDAPAGARVVRALTPQVQDRHGVVPPCSARLDGQARPRNDDSATRSPAVRPRVMKMGGRWKLVYLTACTAVLTHCASPPCPSEPGPPAIEVETYGERLRQQRPTTSGACEVVRCSQPCSFGPTCCEFWRIELRPTEGALCEISIALAEGTSRSVRVRVVENECGDPAASPAFFSFSQDLDSGHGGSPPSSPSCEPFC